jgi:hypothetical protein
MIKVENVEVAGFETAVRAMRNALNSHDKSDSGWFWNDKIGDVNVRTYFIGDNDLGLMKRLYKAGSSHRKYARQIYVGMDITTNHTVWSQLDTYKVGTVRNSGSKMHRIHVKSFEPDDFSHEGISEVGGRTVEVFNIVLKELERLRVLFNETHEKKYWRAMIDLLPMGYNLRATVTLNYENIFNIISQRAGHKMFEWDCLIGEFKKLPYIKQIMGETE